MDLLDFNERIADSHVKWLKKMLRMQRLSLYFNATSSILVCGLLYYISTNIFTAICAGILINNTIWCAGDLILNKQELKLEMERLNRLKEIKDKNEFREILSRIKERDERMMYQHTS